jgi:RNA recognition motif-containing protein
VFVGNVNYETTQADLETLFSEVGQISEVFLPVDRTTGRPRGFAFVTFVESDAAKRAIEKFEGFEFKGRRLHVNAAQERPQRPSGFSNMGPPPDSWNGRSNKSKGSRRNIRARKRSL